MTSPNTTSSFELPFFLVKDGKKASEARIRKIISYTPEVMVKITGFTHDFGHVRAHLNYISRKGTLELEDENGGIYSDPEDIRYLSDYWQAHHWDSPQHQTKARCTSHLVLSMPYGTDIKPLKEAVRSFAKETFADYRYVMALHQDTDHPHMHLTVHNCGKHGKKLQIKRGDPQKWREAFALELDKRGIDAEATPRAVRGIVVKSVSGAIIHMKNKGLRLDIAKNRMDEIRALWGQDKTTMPPRPWETAIAKKQKAIRSAWLSLAERFKDKDLSLSDTIIAFVKQMPDPLTKRESINLKIFASVRDKTKAQQILKDHPELKGDIDKIRAAENYAIRKYPNSQQQEAFMHKVIADIAHRRLNGEALQTTHSAQHGSDKSSKQKIKKPDKDLER